MGSKLKLCEVTYFNAEHPKHKVSSLLSGNGKWTSPIRFKEDLICEFSLQGQARITRIDIGNFWSASVEVSVGLSSWPSSKRELLASHNFMNRITSISGDNKEQMITFTGAHFKEVSETYWDRIRITCKQPYRFDNDCFGLSIVDVTGNLKSNCTNIAQTPETDATGKVEESELNTFIQEKFNMMKPTTKQSPFRPFSSIFSAKKSSEKRSPLSVQKTSLPEKASTPETDIINVQNHNTPSIHEKTEMDESNDLELKSARFFEKCLKFLETMLKDHGLEELEVVSYNMVKRMWIQKFGQDVSKQEKRILKLASEQYLVERVELLQNNQKNENKLSSDCTKKRKLSSTTSDQSEEKENKRVNRNAIIDLPEVQSNIEIIDDSPSSSSRNTNNETPSRRNKRLSSSSEKKQPAKRQRVKSGSRTKTKPDMKAVPNADGWYSPINARNAMEAEKTLPLKFTKAVLGYNPANLLKIPLDDLEQAGILFQRYNYKTDRCLPLRDSEKPLNVESYETLRFFKCGPDIFLVHRNKFYDPLVEEEHVERVFKNHSATKVKNNKPLIKEIKEYINNYGKTEDPPVEEVVLVDEDDIESGDKNADTAQVDVKDDEEKDEKKRKESMVECPMCSKLFSPSLIQEHAADCTGLEDNFETSEAPLNSCPLCNKEMELDVLEEHAATCTGESEETTQLTVSSSTPKSFRFSTPNNTMTPGENKSSVISVDDSPRIIDVGKIPKFGDCPVCQRRMKMEELEEHAMGCQGIEMNGGNGLHVNIYDRKARCDFCNQLIPEIIMDEHVDDCPARGIRKRVIPPAEKIRMNKKFKNNWR